ncbi:phosphoglycerate mutase-like protein, partial [Glonium stellatum]
MLALFLAIMAATWLINAEDTYQLHAAVVVARTGERTPAIDSSVVRQLTALGAQQLYSAGEAFRGRYINSLNGRSTALGSAPIIGLSANVIDNDETYVLAPDEAWLVASAQAFLQGLYPPFTLSRTAALMLDPSYILANGTYMEYPLDGYQYAQVHTASDLDPTSIWVQGSENCLNTALSGNEYYDTEEFANTQATSELLYQAVGFSTLKDVLSQPQWDYSNAYLIYDYLNYQYSHDSSTYALLSDNISFAGAYDQLRYYSDQQQWALFGNTTADNGVRTMAGKTLAARVLGQFQQIVATSGETPKLTLLFTEHEPFLSFFALAELEFLNSNFYGLPAYGSTMAFELFSLSNSTDFPAAASDLWVRFHFHNGTGFTNDSSPAAELQAFPLFARGPSNTDVPWLDFQDLVSRVMTSAVMDWCTACDAQVLFCDAFTNSSIVIALPPGADPAGMSPAVAGVVGAAATLGALSVLLALAMAVGGVRFRRVGRSQRARLGGFKGGAKMASDADLALPKNGAAVGVVAVGEG